MEGMDTELHSEILSFFEDHCKRYTESLSEILRKHIGINGNTDAFCRSLIPKVSRLLELFLSGQDDAFKSEAVELGRRIFRKNLPVSVVVNAFNSLLFDSIDFASRSTFSEEFSLFLAFVRKVTNYVALGFIYESVSAKERFFLRESVSRSSVRTMFQLFLRIRKVLYGEGDTITERNCPLSQLFDTLEFRLVSSKHGIRRQLELLHEAVHTHENLFKEYFKRGNYLSAYLTLVNFYHTLEKLIHLFVQIERGKNAVRLEDIVNFLASEKGPFVLFALDPKHLSSINRALGYNVGDEIFRYIDSALQAKFQGSSYAVFRCFHSAVCVLVEGKLSGIDFEGLFKRIRLKLKRRFRELPTDVDISGFLIKVPQELSGDKDAISSAVRLAIRESKRRVGELFTLDLSSEEEKREVIILKNLYKGIVESLVLEGVGIVLQGIYSPDGKVEHWEALVRFKDDEGNIVPAYKFIDLLYDYNLIDRLDILVLKKVQQNVHLFKGKSIFFNLSPVTLTGKRSGSQLRELTRSLVESGLGLNFGFEITEQAALEAFLPIVDFFREFNLPLAIDDFGNGYSSFSKFIDLVELVPVKYLKIDGSYVKRLTTSDKAVKVVRTIVSMANSLGIKTIAEFVESEEIFKLLKEMGVELFQGYYFGKPQLVV